MLIVIPDDADAIRQRLQVLEDENAQLKARLAIYEGERWTADREGRFQQIFEQSPASMAVLRGEQLRFEHVNTAYQRALSLGDVLGKPVREVLGGRIERRFIELMEEAYRRGRAVRARNFQMPGDEGSQRDFLYLPQFDSLGRVDGIFVQEIDIAEQRRVESAFAQERERYEFLFNTMDEGFCVIEFFDGPMARSATTSTSKPTRPTPRMPASAMWLARRCARWSVKRPTAGLPATPMCCTAANRFASSRS